MAEGEPPRRNAEQEPTPPDKTRTPEPEPFGPDTQVYDISAQEPTKLDSEPYSPGRAGMDEEERTLVDYGPAAPAVPPSRGYPPGTVVPPTTPRASGAGSELEPEKRSNRPLVVAIAVLVGLLFVAAVIIAFMLGSRSERPAPTPTLTLPSPTASPTPSPSPLTSPSPTPPPSPTPSPTPTSSPSPTPSPSPTAPSPTPTTPSPTAT